MKKIFFLLIGILFLSAIAYTQPNKKPPTQADIDKMMEEATKNMTPEKKEQMKKMMAAVMPAIDEKNKPAFYPEFTDNKQLIPRKDMTRINAIPKKKLTEADISAYATNLYNKIMANGSADEIALIKKLTATLTSANDFGNAAIVSMLQGHPQVAMALSIKAVQAEPGNANWQNNMASLLTQYGYPEKAIPVLQKLKNVFFDNSTVLNNLAQAWLGLGATDSARVYSLAALKSNPNNADALQSSGVLDEAAGNTQQAIEKYKQAMEQSPDPVAETLLKNSTGKAGIDKLDWDKVKNNITIYEYFPKNWIQVPELSDNVSGFETDAATQNGYSKMFQLLQKDIKKVFAVASSQVNKSIKKGSEEFAKEMMNEYMMNGYSFISKPAAIIISIIHIKMAKLAAEFVAEKQKLDSLITQKQEEKNNAGKDDNCGQRDRRNNQFLSEVNPMIRKLFAKYSEEYRVLMNAFCTWIWYESGNIKNTSMSFCLGYTEFYANWLRDAIAAQKRYSPCGIEGIRADRENPVPLPKIPSFNCPTVVSMPVGMDWHALDIAMKNFDGNSLNINKSAGTPLPNMSIAYGIGGKMIAQPGQAPFTKIANGTILPEYGTDKDDSHLNSIAPSPSEREYQAALEKRLSELLKKRLQKMLNNMMLDNCDELQSLKDLEKKKFWEEKKRKVDESLKKHEDIDKMTDDATKEITTKRLSEEIQKMYDEMSKSKYNPQPSLNSSMQAPNTFTPQPGLFK